MLKTTDPTVKRPAAQAPQEQRPEEEIADLGPLTLKGRLQSFRYAARGVRLMLRSQHNAWLHAVASCLVGIVGGLCVLSAAEWCWIVLAIMAVWTAEALNTALEFLADVASPEFHPLIEKAKDVAAGGVLMAAGGAFVIGVLVLGPHVLDLFRGLFRASEAAPIAGALSWVVFHVKQGNGADGGGGLRSRRAAFHVKHLRSHL